MLISGIDTFELLVAIKKDTHMCTQLNAQIVNG